MRSSALKENKKKTRKTSAVKGFTIRRQANGLEPSNYYIHGHGRLLYLSEDDFELFFGNKLDDFKPHRIMVETREL